jgi:hypothetical protein
MENIENREQEDLAAIKEFVEKYPNFEAAVKELSRDEVNRRHENYDSVQKLWKCFEETCRQ